MSVSTCGGLIIWDSELGSYLSGRQGTLGLWMTSDFAEQTSQYLGDSLATRSSTRDEIWRNHVLERVLLDGMAADFTLSHIWALALRQHTLLSALLSSSTWQISSSFYSAE